MSSKTLAIIPARGGSKRIPRKNIKPFLGRPIIQYSIEAAQDAGCFSEVMISTDDEDIGRIGSDCGATLPFYRSAATSGDHAMTADVVREVLLEYANRGSNFDFVCCIYPTAAFLTGAKLLRAFEMLRQPAVDAVVPVVRFGFPIQRAFRVRGNRVEMIWPENRSVRSQDLEPAYHDAGQFYWLNVSRFLQLNSLFPPATVPMELPETEVQDIDNEIDWQLAELKFKLLMSEQ